MSNLTTLEKKPVPVRRRKWLRRIVAALVIMFALMNVMAYYHAKAFTHFDPDAKEKTKGRAGMGLGEKLSIVFWGIQNPRPVNRDQPDRVFETVTIQSNKRIECWLMKAENPIGTVVLCHGYGGDKSQMLDKAELFFQMGYNTLLPDFMGSGGSEGNVTTIGFYESEEVKSCVEFLKERGEKNIILFGTSMGAAAILKAMADNELPVQKLILECPFASLSRTVKNRFKLMGVPRFPMAQLLVFWGGVQHGFNGFAHNPSEYARKVKVPVLMLYGAKDDRVGADEITEIMGNLAGEKKLIIFPEAGHENYLIDYEDEWKVGVTAFIND
jgi:uncharacterized protein